ncbi:MAG: hypothetical protein WA549_01870 [Thermoplasmata archaeon]
MMSASTGKVLDPASQAYTYSEFNPALPNLWEPNLDNYCYVYSANVNSVSGYGGYSATGPSDAQVYIQWLQTLHYNSDLRIVYQAQLVAGETATFTLELSDSTGDAVALYEWINPIEMTGSEVVYKIPNSTPPTGSTYRIENSFLGFTGGNDNTPTGTIVRMPDGFILSNFNNVTAKAANLGGLATGGYSSQQTGPDSGEGQHGTQVVWSIN